MDENIKRALAHRYPGAEVVEVDREWKAIISFPDGNYLLDWDDQDEGRWDRYKFIDDGQVWARVQETQEWEPFRGVVKKLGHGK